MKGKIGTSMQGIEYAPQKRGNIYCKDCKYLIYRGGNISPYICTLKNKARHYTSKVVCKRFEKKISNKEKAIKRHNERGTSNDRNLWHQKR